MKALILLLAVGTGTFLYNEMNDSSSDFGQTAHQFMNEIQDEIESGGGSWSGNYASTAAGRPNTSNWAARGGSSVGTAPDPQPRFGGADTLSAARKAVNDAYDKFVSLMNTYGSNSSSANQAYQEYLNAKYHYDALANQIRRNGNW